MRIFAGGVGDNGLPVFRTDARMRDDQMASTLARALDLFVEEGLAAPPAS